MRPDLTATVNGPQIGDLTTARLAELRRLADEATPGPWEHSKAYRLNVVAPDGQIIGRVSGSMVTDAVGESFNGTNAAFIAAARSAVPALLDALARVEALVSGWERDSSLIDCTRRETCCADARDDERVDVVLDLRAAIRGDGEEA